MKFTSFGLSDIGPCRQTNEDVWTALPDVGFFALADGMGGHLAGEVAAKEAIESLTSSFKSLPLDDTKNLAEDLRKAIEKANSRVYRLGQKKSDCAGMGTTLCCLIPCQNGIVYAHVGDSRIYRRRHQKLELLTRDHSLYAQWQSYSRPSHTPFPYKNVITKAVGTSPKAEPEIASSDLQEGDLFLLCSDGLSDVLSLQEIEKELNETPSLEAAGNALVKQAKIKGGSDNMTLVLIAAN